MECPDAVPAHRPIVRCSDGGQASPLLSGKVRGDGAGCFRGGRLIRTSAVTTPEDGIADGGRTAADPGVTDVAEAVDLDGAAGLRREELATLTHQAVGWFALIE